MLSRFSRILLCATLWTIGCQAPLSLGFSRQEYWSGVLLPYLGDLPVPQGLNLHLFYLLLWQADSLLLAWEAQIAGCVAAVYFSNNNDSNNKLPLLKKKKKQSQIP